MVKTKLNLQIRSYVCVCLVFTVYEQIHKCLFLKPTDLSECKEQMHDEVCSTNVLFVDKTYSNLELGNDSLSAPHRANK